jgi:hypothetical protein
MLSDQFKVLTLFQEIGLVEAFDHLSEPSRLSLEGDFMAVRIFAGGIDHLITTFFVVFLLVFRP